MKKGDTRKKIDRKPRMDKERNKGKVVKELLTNPFQTQREIAKNTGMSLGNVNDKLNDIEQNGVKDNRILAICDKDIENVSLGQNELNRRLQEEPTKIKISDIVQIIQEGTKRYTLFKGDVTGKDGGLKMELTDEQKRRIAERFLNG